MWKFVRNLCFLLGLTQIMACDPECCCTNIDMDVSMHYQSTNGEEIINSSPQFDASKIKIYFKDKEEFVLAYSANLDNPHYFSVVEDSTKTWLKVFTSDIYHNQNLSTTLIKLNEYITDTLVCQHTFNCGVQVSKVWLNGIEQADRNQIEIVK